MKPCTRQAPNRDNGKSDAYRIFTLCLIVSLAIISIGLLVAWAPQLVKLVRMVSNL